MYLLRSGLRICRILIHNATLTSRRDTGRLGWGVDRTVCLPFNMPPICQFANLPIYQHINNLPKIGRYNWGIYMRLITLTLWTEALANIIINAESIHSIMPDDESEGSIVEYGGSNSAAEVRESVADILSLLDDICAD